MERRKRLTADEVKAVFAVIDSFDVLTDSEAPFRMHREVATLAKRFGLTAYDAAYLELALRDEHRLATLDKDLRLAAVALGVECIPS
jgi:predicted nucleic acid-binding protein